MAVSFPPLFIDRADVRIQLDRLAAGGQRHLRVWRLHRAWREAVPWALWGLTLAPALSTLQQLARLAHAPVAASPSLGLVLVGSLVGAGLVGTLRVLWLVVRYRPTRAAGLRLYDRQLDTADRLVAAAELLESPTYEARTLEGGFIRAAIADADAVIQVALTTPLSPLPVPAFRFPRRCLWSVPLALGLLLVSRIAGTHVAPGDENSAAITATSTASANRTIESSRAVSDKPPIAATPSASAENATGGARPPASPTPRDRKSDGQPGSGGTAQANQSQAGASTAAEATNQRGAPPKPPTAQRAPSPETPSARTNPKEKKRPNKGGQLASDANSGQGKSSSSSSSLNPLEALEESDKAGDPMLADAEDEAAEDEDEHEKSNSVSKPTGQTKDPMVTRNLGNMPPQEGDDPGNGRGGPGGLKKTRGVPSLILGIPVPDRVPGTPGPGRSKVSQEFSSPQEESHPAIPAQDRSPRSGAVGPVTQPDLPSWQRGVIENYFRALRAPRSEMSPPAAGAP